MKILNIKHIQTVSVEYIESGTFVGGEEECYDFGASAGKEFLVIQESDYAALKSAASKYVKILKLLTDDETGDIEFLKYSVRRIVENKK